MANDTNTILNGGKIIKAKFQDGSEKDIKVAIISHLRSDELFDAFDFLWWKIILLYTLSGRRY